MSHPTKNTHSFSYDHLHKRTPRNFKDKQHSPLCGQDLREKITQ